MHDIYVKIPSENFIKDVKSSINRFKMKKVMTMMTENMKELKAAKGNTEEESHFQQLHQITLLRIIRIALQVVVQPHRSRLAHARQRGLPGDGTGCFARSAHDGALPPGGRATW
jgi:hypothetical protein